MRDQIAALSIAKRRATKAGKACASAEKRVAKLERKLVNTKVKLVQAKNVNFTGEKEVADLKATVKDENKFYDMGFAEVENSSEPIMIK